MRIPSIGIASFALLAVTPFAFANPVEVKTDDASENESPALEIPAEEIEKLRKQLGPEFSIESKTLEIPFQRDDEKLNQPPVHWNGNNDSKSIDATIDPDQELQQLSLESQQHARRLEALAYAAELQENYSLADRLRDLARREWQMSRDLRTPTTTVEATAAYYPATQTSFNSFDFAPSAARKLPPIDQLPKVFGPAWQMLQPAGSCPAP